MSLELMIRKKKGGGGGWEWEEENPGAQSNIPRNQYATAVPR